MRRNLIKSKILQYFKLDRQHKESEAKLKQLRSEILAYSMETRKIRNNRIISDPRKIIEIPGTSDFRIIRIDPVSTTVNLDGVKELLEKVKIPRRAPVEVKEALDNLITTTVSESVNEQALEILLQNNIFSRSDLKPLIKTAARTNYVRIVSASEEDE
jgi:hypothetical protein